MTRTIYVYENPENGEIIESPCEINGWTPVRTYDIDYPDPGSGGGGGTVDQTYDATSTNAQSGRAVAEAIADKAAQSSVIALQNTAENLRLANEATEAELTDFKDNIAIDLGGIFERLDADESALAAKQDKHVYAVDKPEGSNPASGNVVQVGAFTNTDGAEYGIYEFYYRTSALPAADATKTYSFSPLLDDYTIFDFIDQSGITSNGHVISSGRTDGTNRIIIQQFSKNNKNVMIRAYGDYTQQTALLRIKFIGTKNNA